MPGPRSWTALALPLAHTSLALGLTSLRDLRGLVFVAFLSFSPDLDFLLVWGLDLPRAEYHRTFSHSIVFCLVVAVIWAFIRPRALRNVSSGLCFAVLLSHAALDILCTADTVDHGVLLLWPLNDYRFGYPVLVPLYRLFGDSPFSLEGAWRFTLLECLLAIPFWYTARVLRLSLFELLRRVKHE